MRVRHNAKVLRLVFGIGILALAIGVPLVIWAMQQGPTDTSTPRQPAQLEYPGGDSATVGEAALNAGSVSRADSATLGESAEVEVQRAQAAPAGGGRGARARVQDSVEFIIRDASGRVKEHKVIGK